MPPVADAGAQMQIGTRMIAIGASQVSLALAAHQVVNRYQHDAGILREAPHVTRRIRPIKFDWLAGVTVT